MRSKKVYWGEQEYVISVEVEPGQWMLLGHTLSEKRAEQIVSEINAGTEISNKTWVETANAGLKSKGLNLSF